MNDESNTGENSSEQVQVPQAKTKATAAKPVVDLIATTAADVEQMSKTKALNLAIKLTEDIDNHSFILGGVLKRIYENSWFEGFETFDQFVRERYGISPRTAKYLMSIYTHLVTKQIPWDKVAKLRWPKLKDLAPILTQENVDDWVAKAEQLTVIELIAAIHATMAPATGEKPKTSDEIVTIKFKLHKDQAETVTTAISKAKAEVNSDVDTVALSAICTGFLAGGAVVTDAAVGAHLKGMGWQKALTMVAELFPEVDINAEPATTA